jgi:hypothetical protein
MKKGGVSQQLNLAHLEARLAPLLDAARAEPWTSETFLARALAAEGEGREHKALARRLTSARIPANKTLDGFDVSDPSLAVRASVTRAGGSLVCASLDHGHRSWPAGNWENTCEPGAGHPGPDRRPFGALYDTCCARSDAGACVASRTAAPTPAPLHCAQPAGQ